MHGLIFVTWEKYLADTFGASLLQRYRAEIGETPSSAPLVHRVYDDATMLTGVGAASRLTGEPVERLLRGFGRYYLLNGLTNHLCAYLLGQVNNGRDLLLTMRTAHAQLRHLPEDLTPPLFSYEALPNDPQGLILTYDSPRRLCDVLWGAVEGAAERYGQQAAVREVSCMKRGAPTCRFEIHFSATRARAQPHNEEEEHKRLQNKRWLADLVLSVLPSQGGLTLAEVQFALQHRVPDQNLLRVSVLQEALWHLQHAGLVASTSNQPGENLFQRRYWRVPVSR